MQGEKQERSMYELFRGMRLLLEHFGIADRAVHVMGEYLCITVPYDGTYEPYRNTYAECIYYCSLHPGYKIITMREFEILRNWYEVVNGKQFDVEYRQMLQENREIDQEMKRRKQARKKRKYNVKESV